MIGDPLIRIVSGGIVGDEVDPSRFDVGEIVGRGGREIGDVEDVDASVIDDGIGEESRFAIGHFGHDAQDFWAFDEFFAHDIGVCDVVEGTVSAAVLLGDGLEIGDRCFDERFNRIEDMGGWCRFDHDFFGQEVSDAWDGEVVGLRGIDFGQDPDFVRDGAG